MHQNGERAAYKATFDKSYGPGKVNKQSYGDGAKIKPIQALFDKS